MEGHASYIPPSGLLYEVTDTSAVPAAWLDRTVWETARTMRLRLSGARGTVSQTWTVDSAEDEFKFVTELPSQFA